MVTSLIRPSDHSNDRSHDRHSQPCLDDISISQPLLEQETPEVSPPIKLLYVTTIPATLYFHLGQIQYMKDRGFEVSALSSPGNLPVQLAGENAIEVHFVEMPRRITPWHDLKALYRLWQTIRQIQPDLIHASTPKGGLLGTIAAFLARVPARIYQMRGLPLMTATGWKYALLWLTEWIACRLSHDVICVSHGLRSEAIDRHLCAEDKIHVLRSGSSNGVDALTRFNPDRYDPRLRNQLREQYGIPNDAIVVGYVGRIVKDKGLNELTEAWKTVERNFSKAHLVIVGGFEDQDPVAPETRQFLHEHPSVHLIGEVEETSPLYMMMDIFVLPTYREGFPNVLLEASAMKLPIVTTDIPGCVDAVNHCENGLVVPVRDAPALSKAIASYLQSTHLRQLHGNQGRDRILSQFTQEDLWESLYQSYLQLLKVRQVL